MPDPDFDLVTAFADSHERTYGRVLDGGPPWTDGSDAAALLAIWWHLEPMVANGGWPAVYYNRVAWSVPLAARGYRVLGMDECAKRCDAAESLVRRAEAAHPGHDHTTDQWLASTLMEAIDESTWDTLDGGWPELTADTCARMASHLRHRP